MSNFSLHVDVLAGTSFEDAVKEAIEVRSRFNFAYVKFKFNGISVSVGKKASIDSNLLGKLHKAYENESKFLIL